MQQQPPPAAHSFDTMPNRFGVFRRYTTVPQHDPEEGLTLDDFADGSSHIRTPPDPREQHPLRPLGSALPGLVQSAMGVAAKSYAPFLNWSVFKLMQWQYNGTSTKSEAQLQRLIDEVLTDKRFRKKDLVGCSVKREKKRLDQYSNNGGPFDTADGWREGSVTLHLPKARVKHTSESAAPSYTITGIWMRNFMEVLKAGYKDPVAGKFHHIPFSLFRSRSTPEDPDAPPERLWSEVYNANAMLREHDELQAQPRQPEDAPDVEYVIAPLLVYSDSTRLANFGTASLWPIYNFFASLTKYLRLKPSMFAAHHLAYIPSVSRRGLPLALLVANSS